MGRIEHHEDGANGTVMAYENGVAVGVVWGPSSDGEGAWFVRLDGEISGRRMPSRDEAIALLPQPTEAVA